MNDLGFDYREQDEHHPEHDPHPAGEIAGLLVGGCTPAVVLEKEGRCREAAQQQDDEMVEERSAMPRIFGAEQAYLVGDEFIDEPPSMRSYLYTEPDRGGYQGRQYDEQYMADAIAPYAAVDEHIDTEGQ